MGIKLVKKTNEADLNKFDVSDVIDDSKKFDFINLLARLEQFKNWMEDLHAHVYFTMPKIHYAAYGASGFCYRISNEDRSTQVQFNIEASTNAERYAKFEGYIYAVSPKETANDKSFPINSIDDLTDALAQEIVDICKGRT
jgi:hypothetical protein